MDRPCNHLDAVVHVTPSDDGCHECLQNGGRWVHLRICQACGHVGCCDNPPAATPTRHYGETRHPLIRSFEPGEDWWWCYPDELFFEVDGAPAAPSHA